ncbi:PQQ-binding-like beta-propeller repeat protein [Halorubrum sp. N11]|uniref:outer membrane protein assembly factor BamB family protein n=1 Tax=Halorubrum sp. N11 TaxID=3402276 RepID=UPI003EBCC428
MLDHDVEPAGEAALQWIHERDPGSFAGANPIATGEYIAMRIDNNLEVLDAATGDRHWHADERNATPVRMTDQHVEAIISIRDGNALVTYNLADGTEHNRLEIDEGLRPATVTADSIYYTTYDNDTRVGKLVARDRPDGEVRWRVSIDEAHPATPAVEDETVVVGVQQTNTDSDHNGIVLAVDRTTGAEKWRFTELPRVRSPVAVTADTVFATSSDGPALTAIDAATGDHRWTTQTLNGTHVAPVVADEAVYLGTTDEELYKLDRADGSPNWRVDLAGRTGNASMALVGRTLYVPRAYAGPDGDRSLVAAIDVDAGDVVWDVLVDNRNLSSIAPAGNTVFVGTTDFGSTESPDRLLAFAAGPTEE